MGSWKNKCNGKEREKGILKIIVWQRRGTFFGKEVLPKCAKVMPKGIQTRECFKQKDYANNLYQRKYYETPLYGNVRGDSKGDKGRGMRKRRSP
jgi:hypothetical protein